MLDMSSYQNIKPKDRRRSSYHLVFVPKYRRCMFKKSVNNAIVRELLKAVFEKYCSKLHALEVAPNHVHAFVEISNKVSVWQTIRSIKQVSARLIFKAIPKYRLTLRKGRFWSRYTFYESIGKVTASKIQKYIEESQVKHIDNKSS
ncbi:MAG: IS200/IS605 family transposase [Candidatus Diapherotrites archaeon]